MWVLYSSFKIPPPTDKALGAEEVADTRRHSIRLRNSQVRAEEQVPITADDLQRRLDPVLRAGEQAASVKIEKQKTFGIQFEGRKYMNYVWTTKK